MHTRVCIPGRYRGYPGTHTYPQKIVGSCPGEIQKEKALPLPVPGPHLRPLTVWLGHREAEENVVHLEAEENVVQPEAAENVMQQVKQPPLILS